MLDMEPFMGVIIFPMIHAKICINASGLKHLKMIRKEKDVEL